MSRGSRCRTPYVTREITVRDLLVHRSGLGLGAGDLLWWPASTYNRKEIAQRLRYIPLATSFRSAYAYDNVLYLVAGEVIEAVSGLSLGGFRPDPDPGEGRHDGEQRTALRRDQRRQRRRAPCAGRRQGAADRGRSTATTPIPPAASTPTPTTWRSGCSRSSIDGRLADRSALIKPAHRLAAGHPRDPDPDRRRAAGDCASCARRSTATASASACATIGATSCSTHTGGLPGYVSKVAMVPDARLGVAILTNQESDAAFEAIVNRIMDQLPRRAGHRLDRRLPGRSRSASAAAQRPRPRSRPRRPRRGVEAVAAAREIRRHLSRRLVRRHDLVEPQAEAGDQVQRTPHLIGDTGALAV